VVSCCDAFSAMTTTRSYRSGMSIRAAVDELNRNEGTQFDPEVVAALVEVVRRSEDPRRLPAAQALEGPVGSAAA
jgi:HD-GYP domain-containing protein (c-di-GMP phosphodiesterase class II)